MSGIRIKMTGMDELERKLQDISRIRFDSVVKKNVTQMLNRARNGGTPVSTEKTRPGGPHGELRISSSTYGDEVGYTREYAPHVEYGHRTIDGGFVEGQRFLQRNVEIQQPIYHRDLLDAIKKG